jgi:hypothetical protein
VQAVAVAGGLIQILEDVRLTPRQIRMMWQGSIEPFLTFGENSPEDREFTRRPLRPAMLRQIDGAGRTVVDILIEEQAPPAGLGGSSDLPHRGKR